MKVIQIYMHKTIIHFEAVCDILCVPGQRAWLFNDGHNDIHDTYCTGHQQMATDFKRKC